MPSLVTLPMEILALIVRFVGSDYLRARSERLLICKRWHQIAQVVAYEDLTFTFHHLRSFNDVSSKMWQLIYQTTKHFTIRLVGYDDWPRLRQISSHDHLFPRDPPIHDTTHVAKVREMWLSHWNLVLNSALIALAPAVANFSKLQSFRFQALVEEDPDRPQGTPRDYIWAESLSALYPSLAQPTLDTVEFDTRNSSRYFGLGNGMDLPLHQCPRIADHLPRWRHVRLRMRGICPEVLSRIRITEHQPCRLETLIINLSMVDTRSSMHSNPFSSSDDGLSSHTGWDLYQELVEQAYEAVKVIPTIKSLKVICHNTVPLRLAAEDCVTGKKTKFSEGARDWEDPNEETDHDDEDEDLGEDDDQSSTAETPSTFHNHQWLAQVTLPVED